MTTPPLYSHIKYIGPNFYVLILTWLQIYLQNHNIIESQICHTAIHIAQHRRLENIRPDLQQAENSITPVICKRRELFYTHSFLKKHFQNYFLPLFSILTKGSECPKILDFFFFSY